MNRFWVPLTAFWTWPVLLLLALLCCSSCNNCFAHSRVPLKVVFVGKYRSGSTSIAQALRRLGYNACHGQEVVNNVLGSHSRLADAFIEGNVTEILEATSDLGCNAAMELHAIFWKQIAADPTLSADDTKYIVVRRDQEAWTKSVVNLHLAVAPIHRFPLRWLPKYGKLSKLFASLSQREGGFETIEQALQVVADPLGIDMREGMERVYHKFVMDTDLFLRNNPKNTLLFDLRDGYPALCNFLNVTDCPQELFPHAHSTMHVMAKYSVPRRLEVAINGVLLVLGATLTALVWGNLRRGVLKSKSA